MINDYENGALKMSDTATSDKAFKSVWIKKKFYPENKGNCKCFLDLQLREYGGNIEPIENLKVKDTKYLKISDPFVKEIFEIWSEICFEETKTSDAKSLINVTPVRVHK